MLSPALVSNTSHGGNDNQGREIKNIWIDYTKHGKYNMNIIRGPIQKIYKHGMHPGRRKKNCYITIKLKYGFLGSINSKLKKN